MLLLALAVIGAGIQIAFGSAGDSAGGSRSVAATATPTPASGRTGAVERSLAAVERAFNTGAVRRLCRRGRLVDPAVIATQDADGPGCEAELETLVAHAPPLQLTVRRVALRADLATVTVTTASGQEAAVDMVRWGAGWQLSFSNGSDPMPVLAGTE